VRPFAPPPLTDTSYGSSFLVGPVSYVNHRPLVELTDVTFEPQTRSFELRFRRGGSAEVRTVALDEDHHTLEVRFSEPTDGAPFAMLRSMYVTESNNDVARVATRNIGEAWREAGIMGFTGGRATDVWLGRLVPSRHNTFSPDMVFADFSTTDQPHAVLSWSLQPAASRRN
jgi:hypothetical protein